MSKAFAAVTPPTRSPSPSPASEERWVARLELNFHEREGRTVMGPGYRCGPLAVQRPFYPGDGVCHTYVLHPPGGLAGGDVVTIVCNVHDFAKTLVTTPGATKFYRCEGRKAVQRQLLNVGAGAALEWLPQEAIYFENANCEVCLDVSLAHDARLAVWDIACFGRPANRIALADGSVVQRIRIRREGMPKLIEQIRITGELVDTATVLRGYQTCATAVFTPADSAALGIAQAACESARKGLFGATLVDDLLVVRCLTQSAEDARNVLTDIWAELRPSLFGDANHAPRIWRT